MTATAPLTGLRVLDLTELLPGPYATQQMSEMGAEVIKVERPSGDAARAMFPGLFAAVNRGKKSICLNLKDDPDRAAFLRLARRADVVIEGYRPGVTARLGIDYETLSTINPGLIYCSISGYGQTGPARDWPGHDLNYAAMAGAVAISGAPDGPPEYTTGVPIGDLSAATYAIITILAALRARDTTGRGQYLDVAITDAMASWVAPRHGVWDAGRRDGRDVTKADILRRAAYGIFKTADGKYITIGAIETHFFRRLIRATGMTGFDDPAFDDFAKRLERTDDIQAALVPLIGAKSFAHWAKVFEAEDVPFAPINALEDLARDPHLKARGVVRNVGEAQVMAFPVQMEGIGDPADQVPEVGQHQAEILGQTEETE
jgi:crotonobetainyl-CoA:carnitine CoA-transferase CaiB-like acyl-CoA transferase